MGAFHCQVTDSFLSMLASPPKNFRFLFLKTERVPGDGRSDMFDGRQNSKVQPRKMLATNNNKLKNKKEKEKKKTKRKTF